MRPIIAIALTGFLVLQSLSQAQQPFDVIVENRSIHATLVDTPSYSANFGESDSSSDVYKASKWVQIQFEFTCEEPVKGLIEELTFRAYLEAREFKDLNDTQGAPAVLVGECTFINLPAKKGGTKHRGAFYLHPFSVERYGGEKAFRFIGTQKTANNNNVRIEALSGGQPLPLDKSGALRYADMLKDEPGWVDQCKKITGQLLGKDQSPWALAWLDRYPPIKARSTSGQ